jgi:MftR C-terminal domain
MAADGELWRLRLTVIDSTPALVARLVAAFGEGERVLAQAVAERTGTRVGVDAYPALLAGVAGVAMRTALHRWLATDFTTELPDLVDEAWDLLTAGLPAPTT